MIINQGGDRGYYALDNARRLDGKGLRHSDAMKEPILTEALMRHGANPTVTPQVGFETL